jgi:hypothetical protein
LVKTGNNISYDIDSLDLWLDMRVECIEIGLIITFEIKVEKKLTCGALKLNLLEIINQLLSMKNVQLEYDEDDIKLIKASLNEEIIVSKDARSSALDRKLIPKRMHELSDNALIEDQFDYLDRYLICTIQKNIIDKNRESFQRRLTINTNTNNIVTNIFDTVKESMPCRGIKIENYRISKNLEVKLHSIRSEDNIRSYCCRCEIF